MNKNKTLASQLINQIIEKDFVDAKDSFASLIRQKSLTRLGEKKIEVASRMFVSEARDTSPETIAKIKAADKSYSKMSTQELKKLYQQHYRVSNVSGMSKNNLIGDILRAEFGNKAVDLAFESVEETELDEAAKEMTMKQVMQKVNDGEWEAEQDIKVGKHIQFHDYKGKRFVIYITEETELDEASKLSDLSSMQQFQLLNDYLGLKMHGAIRQFRDNPDFVKKAIADHKIDSKTLEAALEKMKKDGNLDRNFKLNEDADLLDEAYVDRFAKKRKENGSELKDWTMKKLDMFRDMPHGSYTNKEIQQEYQRRIKTGEYVKA